MPTLLVRYGELGLKSASVRRRFENALMDDIRRRHALAGTPCVISSTRGRIFVDSDDWRRSCQILSKTFGVVSFSPVTRVKSDLETLTKETTEFARPLMFKGASFAIRPRRTGNHPYTSQSMAQKLGEAILRDTESLGIKVSLDEPDIEIFVEVRDKDAYLSSSVLAGPGGMPLGTQGRVLSILDSENAIASSWLMMKRGCSVLASASDPSLLGPLEKWCPLLKSTPPEDDLFASAARHDCIGIALPWTFREIEMRGALKGDLPVFYPLVGMDEREISGLLNKIRG
ncbi:MAG: THUMP domain-containing protein [Thermoplasmata archaeon]